jgi:hypothetical protein
MINDKIKEEQWHSLVASLQMVLPLEECIAIADFHIWKIKSERFLNLQEKKLNAHPTPNAVTPMTDSTLGGVGGVIFMRKCSECGKGMNEGYCIEQGTDYYCSDECLNKHISPKDWDELYDDGNGDSYWTEWEVTTDEDHFIEKDGKLIEVEVEL